MTSCHIIVLWGFTLINSPKCENGKEFNILEYLSTTPLSNPISPKLLWWKLTPSSETNSNNLRITFIVKTFVTFTSPTNIVSLAYYSKFISHSFLSTTYPSNKFLCLAFLINSINPSTTTKNEKGANESPWWNPLEHLNSWVGRQFTNTKAQYDWRHPLIQLIHVPWNPNWGNI